MQETSNKRTPNKSFHTVLDGLRPFLLSVNPIEHQDIAYKVFLELFDREGRDFWSSVPNETFYEYLPTIMEEERIIGFNVFKHQKLDTLLDLLVKFKESKELELSKKELTPEELFELKMEEERKKFEDNMKKLKAEMLGTSSSKPTTDDRPTHLESATLVEDRSKLAEEFAYQVDEKKIEASLDQDYKEDVEEPAIDPNDLEARFLRDAKNTKKEPPARPQPTHSIPMPKIGGIAPTPDQAQLEALVVAGKAPAVKQQIIRPIGSTEFIRNPHEFPNSAPSKRSAFTGVQERVNMPGLDDHVRDKIEPELWNDL